MGRLRRCLSVLVAASGLALTAVGTGATPALAYGNDAVYQVGFSFNCDNPTAAVCQVSPTNPFGPGGFWGWIEVDGAPGAASGTDGTAQVTGCSHNPPTGPTGAVHFGVPITSWSTVPSPMGPVVLAQTNIPGLAFEFPAASGHYSFRLMPGVNGQIEVQRLR